MQEDQGIQIEVVAIFLIVFGAHINSLLVTLPSLPPIVKKNVD